MSNEIHVAVPDGTELLRFTETVRLGRAATNGIVVPHDLVSAEHLELQRSGDEWIIVDLGSTNGTFVDGKPVTRATLGALTTVRLGRSGPEIRLTRPGVAATRPTRRLQIGDIVDRYFSDDAPEDMSMHTRLIRAAIHNRHVQETTSWMKRTRRLRGAVVTLLVLSVGAGGMAVWQARRVRALRSAAGAVFNTMKSLELDVRRLEATAGPDRTTQAHRARLEAQYEDLLKTLGIYSSGTPADVQLIYRTVHRLGESEATVPGGFVDEVRRYIKQWKAADLLVGLRRANEEGLGAKVASILLHHHLPREFFYLALQESKLDPRAIGPSTPSGVPKGLWQLIPPTAEAYGLRLGPLQGERTFDPSDERYDVSKATEAAARYLEDIYTTEAQASGLLVMASYNMGETRLRGLLRSLPESPAERNFWALLEQHRRELPTETYDYVFRVVSAAVIGANPRLFGFDVEPPLGPPIANDSTSSR